MQLNAFVKTKKICVTSTQITAQNNTCPRAPSSCCLTPASNPDLRLGTALIGFA